MLAPSTVRRRLSCGAASASRNQSGRWRITSSEGREAGASPGRMGAALQVVFIFFSFLLSACLVALMRFGFSGVPAVSGVRQQGAQQRACRGRLAEARNGGGVFPEET